MTLLNKLKKYQFIRNVGKFLRRTVLKNIKVFFITNSSSPISDYTGFDRGIPLDRYYIESFLNKEKLNIAGHCLEVLNNNYTIKFGGSRVTKSDILDIDTNNPKASILGDIRKLSKVQKDTFDTIILTQFFQFIDDLKIAISECQRILRPGGTLLATFPAIGRIDCTSGQSGDYWRFTKASVKYLFENIFYGCQIEIGSFGNVKSGIYFYAGAAINDCPKKILEHNDDNFPTIITLKITK